MLSAADHIRSKADYQQFLLTEAGEVTDIGNRMRAKQKALAGVWPEMAGKRVLDIGCDFGFWSFLAASQGAQKVLGLDRSRSVRDLGPVDLPLLNNQTEHELGRDVCQFRKYEAGVQFHDLGSFDVVLLMSLYHHIYANTGGDHETIWYWLWRQCKKPGMLIWENPTDVSDVVVQGNVPDFLHLGYNVENIREAAERYFTIVDERPALHEDTRTIWVCEPKYDRDDVPFEAWLGQTKDGAGGASKAFAWDNSRRVREIEHILGEEVRPGSLNIELEQPFGWDRRYYRTLVMDLVDRRTGLEGEWRLRPCRFYPVWVDGQRAWAMRFEGEAYPDNFIELISPKRLRDHADGRVKVDR